MSARARKRARPITLMVCFKIKLNREHKSMSLLSLSGRFSRLLETAALCVLTNTFRQLAYNARPPRNPGLLYKLCADTTWLETAGTQECSRVIRSRGLLSISFAGSETRSACTGNASR